MLYCEFSCNLTFISIKIIMIMIISEDAVQHFSILG